MWVKELCGEAAKKDTKQIKIDGLKELEDENRKLKTNMFKL